MMRDLINYAKTLSIDEINNMISELNLVKENREDEERRAAAEKVVKAIQDYVAAGYTLWIKGSVVCDDQGFPYDKDFDSEVIEVTNDDGEVTLHIMDCDLT